MTDKITIDRSVLQQALEALDTVSLELGIDWLRPEFADAGSTATALRAALAAPQPAQPAQPLIDAVAELLGHISDVFDDVEFEKIETKLWNDVSVFVGLYRSHTAPAPLNVVASLGFKLALDADLRRRADKLASALKGSRVNYDVEQDAAKLIWEMRDALAAPQPALANSVEIDGIKTPGFGGVEPADIPKIGT